MVALLYKIDKPFWGHHDWNGAYWGNVARNYGRYPLGTTKLAMITSSGPAKPSDFEYNFHYSPLYPLVLGLVFKVFGVSEVGARGLAVVLSGATLAVFYRLVQKYFSGRVALAALILWIATPMFLYFGKMPVHDVMILFWAVLAVYFYLCGKFYTLVFFLVLALLSGWPGYSLVPAMTLHWWFFRKASFLSGDRVLLLWLVAVAGFASLLVHDKVVTGSFFGGGLAEIFFFRLQRVEVTTFLATMARWLVAYYTFLTGLSLLMVIFWRKFVRGDIALLFLGMALVYPVVFSDSAFRHDYLLVYFLPYLTLASALVLEKVGFRQNGLVAGAIALAAVMVFWRKDFIGALLDSDIYRESVRLGKYINSHSDFADRVWVKIEEDAVGFDGVFTSFYADRAWREGEGDVATFVYRKGGRIEKRGD